MLALREGLVLEGARTIAQEKDATWLQTLRWAPHVTRSDAQGLFLPLCPETMVAKTRGQRSVTLFSRAAAICWRRKASCIFWAAGSSSRALMISS